MLRALVGPALVQWTRQRPATRGSGSIFKLKRLNFDFLLRERPVSRSDYIPESLLGSARPRAVERPSPCTSGTPECRERKVWFPSHSMRIVPHNPGRTEDFGRVNFPRATRRTLAYNSVFVNPAPFAVTNCNHYRN